MLRNSSPTSEIRWLECTNNNAGTVPAFGLVRSTGLDSAGNVFQVDQPNADSMEVMFNGPVPIPAGSNGGCTRDFPAWAYYETSDGTPSVGDVWGAGNGSWKLRINKTGYKIVAVDSTNQRVQVVSAPPAPPASSGLEYALLTKQNDQTFTLTSSSQILWGGVSDPYGFVGAGNNSFVIPAGQNGVYQVTLTIGFCSVFVDVGEPGNPGVTAAIYLNGSLAAAMSYPNGAPFPKGTTIGLGGHSLVLIGGFAPGYTLTAQFNVGFNTTPSILSMSHSSPVPFFSLVKLA